VITPFESEVMWALRVTSVFAKVTEYAPAYCGTDRIVPVTVAVSVAPVDAIPEYTIFAVAGVDDPTVKEEETTEVPSAAFTSESASVAAFAETAENPPKVSATAATAAMRLRLVFVDIIFLSEKVDLKNFFISAWPANTDS
jgi:uncharacterized membrane protein YkvA (DUF1232 family)